jgi:hypothetical protein
MTTDPHHHEQGLPLTRRSLLAMTGAVAGGLGAGVSLAPPASAHGTLMTANEIAGQRLHYYNGSVDNSRPATTFSFNPTTYNHAEAALNFFYVYTPSTWLRPMHLWLNGVHVDKGGMHQYGRAIDVAYIYNTIGGRLTQTFNADWYWWRNQSNMSTYRKRYWGYVASLNRFFNPVLHYWYTPDRFSSAVDYSHQRHVHYDDATSGPGLLATFTASSSRTVQTYTVQSCLTYIWNLSVTIDGYWGSQTDNACRTALSRINRSGTITNQSNYHAFLTESCEAGTGLYVPSLAASSAERAAKP